MHLELSQPGEETVEESGPPDTAASVPPSRWQEGEKDCGRWGRGVTHDSGGFVALYFNNNNKFAVLSYFIYFYQWLKICFLTSTSNTSSAIC